MAEKLEERDSPSLQGPEWGQVGTPSTYIKPQARKLHDPAVKLEEYYYYALKTREVEKGYESPKLPWRQILSRNKEARNINDEQDAEVTEHVTNVNFAKRENRLLISDQEWENASRALRTASWGAAFYLITTDILGPFGVGFALGTLGWGPGIALYTVFGFFAGYSGYLLWKVFLGIDSYQFPCRNYGDVGFRTWGVTVRHITNVLQAIGLLLLLGQVTIQFGQNISAVSKFRLCYIICPLLFVIAGFLLTQIRTLKAYGLVANFAVWINLLVIFMTMGYDIKRQKPSFMSETFANLLFFCLQIRLSFAPELFHCSTRLRGQCSRSSFDHPRCPGKLSSDHPLRWPSRREPRGLDQRPLIWSPRLRWCSAVRGIYGRDETPERLPQSHVGSSILHLRRLYGLRLLHILLPRPV